MAYQKNRRPWVGTGNTGCESFTREVPLLRLSVAGLKEVKLDSGVDDIKLFLKIDCGSKHDFSAPQDEIYSRKIWLGLRLVRYYSESPQLEICQC